MNKFQQFLQNMSGRRVAVIGVGVSNTPLIRLLLEAGAQVTACDKKPEEALAAAPELKKAGAKLVCGGGYLEQLGGFDVIFRTPGMRPDLPALVRAEAEGARVTSEMECFFEVCPCPIIAVTGSDGKTTTTTLISKMLEQAGFRCHIGGNIGTPLLPRTPLMTPDDFAVAELSSFQLFTMRRSPHAAVITNISPNHLDIHRDMEEYVSAKENIFLHQNPGDILVLNAQNEWSARMAEKAPSQVRWFSGSTLEGDGFFRGEEAILCRKEGKVRSVVSLSDIFLPGAHNVENYMAAAAAVADWVSFDHVAEVARSFTGVPHRIEYLRTVDGVRYYNDSIASSPTRTIAGLRSFDRPVILIAGGYDKHIPFDTLGAEMPGRVQLLLLVGDTADKIEAAAKAAPGWSAARMPILRCDTLAEAVARAREAARPGDIVTMSPACASFDRYRNFEERGEAFRALVAAL